MLRPAAAYSHLKLQPTHFAVAVKIEHAQHIIRRASAQKLLHTFVVHEPVPELRARQRAGAIDVERLKDRTSMREQRCLVGGCLRQRVQSCHVI